MHRKLFLAILLLLPALLRAQARQQDTLPYLKYPSLPAFNVLLQDSTTVFNTYYIPEGRPTVIIFFSPDCEHCQQVTRGLMDKIDSLKDAHLLFLTPMSLAALRPFAREMGLNGKQNITLGKDYQYFFFNFYGARYVPYIAVYDRRKKFVKMWEGSLKTGDLIRVLDGL